jgi:hypothetical protein
MHCTASTYVHNAHNTVHTIHTLPYNMQDTVLQYAVYTHKHNIPHTPYHTPYAHPPDCQHLQEQIVQGSSLMTIRLLLPTPPAPPSYTLHTPADY